MHYLGATAPALKAAVPVSILKPLAGLDRELESNLRTFFEQDYPSFEILFAVRDAEDPALAVVEKLRAEYPQVPSRVVIAGEPPYPNSKVFKLDLMMRAAANDLLVMSDSDIRVEPHLLRSVAAEFQDPKLAVATCPYRAMPGPTFWSSLETTGMNTDFISGILVARMIEGMRFAVGPTIVARRSVIQEIGGFDRLKDFLAEDFVMGKFAADAGYGVILSSYVIEHHIGSTDLRHNAAHRLRWVRSTRRSRPAGYVGQLFTMPLPLALILWMAAPAWWPLSVGAIAIRMGAAWIMSRRVLKANLNWAVVPIEDLMAFVFWVAGFFGNTIVWRDRKYRLLADGRFELLK